MHQSFSSIFKKNRRFLLTLFFFLILGLTLIGHKNYLSKLKNSQILSQNYSSAPLATLTNADPVVTVIEMDTTNYSIYEAIKKFYTLRPDEYDSLIVFDDFGSAFQNSIHVKNDVQGIGRGTFDVTASFGSAGRLRTVGRMGNANSYNPPITSPIRGILEEGFAHSFGLYVGGAQDSADSLPVQNSLSSGHWSPCMSFPDQDIATNPYWKARLWQDNGDGSWNKVNEDPNLPNKLDTFMLYLMGLLPPDQVRPAILLNPPGANKAQQCVNSGYSGTPLVATPITIAINDVINRHGPRVPDSVSSPKDFKVAYLLVVQTGNQPSEGTVEKITQWAEDFIPYFNNAVTLNASPTPTPSPTLTPTPMPTFTPTPTPRPPTVTPMFTPSPTPASVNLLQNQSFENTGSNWLSPWIWNVKSGATGTVSRDTSTKTHGLASAKVNITKASTDWYLQLIQKNIPLQSGRTYVGSFWAKGSKNRNIRITLQQSNSPYAVYYQKTFAITTSWKKYSFTYTSNVNQSNSMFLFNLAQSTGQVWLDDVSLKKQ